MLQPLQPKYAFRLGMSRSKEQVQVSLLLLGLGLALTALLMWRKKEVDGFQTTEPPPPPATPIVTINGYLVKSSLSQITTQLTGFSPSDTDSKRKFRVIDEETKTEVWETGMSASKSSDIKRYAILSSDGTSLTLNNTAFSDFNKQGFGTLIAFLKKDSDTSYINAVANTGIVEANGMRVKIDTSKMYPSIKNPSSNSPSLNVYDPINKKMIWVAGQTGDLTPEGIKEIIYYSPDNKFYMYEKDISALINSDQNKQSTDFQFIYPISITSNPDDYVDARTVKYESVKFTPRSTVLLTYGGIGVGVVAVGALLFIAFRAFTKPASPSISLNSIPVAKVVSPPPNTAKQNATKPNVTKPNNKGATVAL